MAHTIVLTGISGFIAKRIAADLLNAGYHVRGTVRRLARADEVRDAVRPALTDAADLETRLTFAEADLTSDAGWAEAMAGATALLHTASPFPIAQPKDEQELIRPAVEGTLRTLRAAQAAGVTRVVLTSSIVAIMHNDRPRGHVYTETDWTDPDHPTCNAYAKSKTLAERAAWEFVAAHPEMQLTTVNPGLVVGRPLDRSYGASLGLVERFMSGKDPVVPNFGLPIVDVADISALHLAALQKPETAGLRVLGQHSYHMMPEVAGWMAAAHPDRKIATRRAPPLLLRVLGLFDHEVRAILPQLGIERVFDNRRARETFGVDFTPAKEALLMAASVVAEAGKSAGKA